MPFRSRSSSAPSGDAVVDGQYAVAQTVAPALGSSAIRRVVGHPVLRIVARRLAFATVLLFVVSAVSFVLVALTPGDAARQILGLETTEDVYARFRHQLGLDQPIYEQYWHWLRNALHGDLGTSVITQESVTHAIAQRLPVTASLILGAVVLTVVFGVAVGLFSALRGGTLSRLVDALALVGFAVPSFWLGAALIAVFAVDLGWLPATGYTPFAQSPSGWVSSLTLPVIALSIHGIAGIAKQTREAMLDALGSEYVRMARASGVSEVSIILQHAFKNAAMRVVTLLGLMVVGLLGGTVFVEAVFALPGLGRLAVDAANAHDLPMIQGVVLFFAMIVVVVNLVIDLAYAWLNPRVRTG